MAWLIKDKNHKNTILYNPFSLEGKTILVTGASSGIGRATAIECSKAGAKVILLGRSLERLNETLSNCVGEGHCLLQCDLADLDSFSEKFSNIPELDGVVHNAGVNTKYLVKNLSKEKIDGIFHTNYYAPVLMTQMFLKKKILKKNASLVFVSSISASLGAVSNSVYASSKGALNSFVRSLALEIAPRGMRANVIQPGMIETPILSAYAMSEELEAFKNSAPLGHPGEPVDIANGCVYLLSEASKFVTGSIFTIDGGITLR